MKNIRLVILLIITAIASNNSMAENYFENILKTIIEIEKNNSQDQKNKDSVEEKNQLQNQEVAILDKPYWYIGNIKFENSIGLSVDEAEKYIESISAEIPFEKNTQAKIKDIFIGDNFTLMSNPRISTLGKITYNNEPTECTADYNKLSLNSLYSTTITCYTDVFGRERGVEISGMRVPPFQTLSYTIFSAKVRGIKISEANIEEALIERMGKPEVNNFFDYRKPIDRCRMSIYGGYYNFKNNPTENEKINDCIVKLKVIKNTGGFFGGLSMMLENGIEKTMRFRKNGTVFELSISAQAHKEVGGILESLMAANSTQSISVYTDKSLSAAKQMSDSVANFVGVQASKKIKHNKNDF